MSDTLSGSKIGLVADLPATYDAAGYAALTYDNGICAVKEMPTINRTWNPVEDKKLCERTSYDKKGTAKWDNMTYTLNIETGDSAQVTYRALEASDDAGSFKFLFQNGDVAYLTAQVSQFSITDGGDGDTLNMGTVTLLPQSDVVYVDAT